MSVLSTHVTLEDLPAPPPGKAGWPWTEASQPLPPTMLNGQPWPKISIITPSYNQGEFIEETIRSVLLQKYPNLEYAVLDGGSTDGSVKIIKKYTPFLSYWASEADKGQSNAINKGFKNTNGEIVAWLNSDDCFVPNILSKIANIFAENSKINFITCPVKRVTAQGKSICVTKPPNTKFKYIFGWTQYMPQAGTFFKRKLLKKVGYLDETLQLQMDYDLWFRFAKETEFFHFQEIAANIKIHSKAKTTANKYKIISQAESLSVKLRYADKELEQEILNDVATQLVAAQSLRNSFWVRLLNKLKLI